MTTWPRRPGPTLASHFSLNAERRDGGLESVLWDAALPLPMLSNPADINEFAPPSLRVVYLLPVSAAVLAHDWSFAAISTGLLALAVSVDAPQWTALVGAALVAGALGSEETLADGEKAHLITRFFAVHQAKAQ